MSEDLQRRGSRVRGIVVTIGTWHDKPWWWEQIGATRLRNAVDYERISLDNKVHRELNLTDVFRLALRLFRVLVRARRERIDYVFTFESDLSCYLIGLLQLVPGLGYPKHVILQFITRDRPPTLGTKLRDLLSRASLATVHRFICSSRAEGAYYAKRFHWKPSRVAFVPLNSDDRLLRQSPRETRPIIVAAGRSYRDYRTLAAAVAGTGIKTVIVCGKGGPGIDEVPAEIEVIQELPFTALMDLMAESLAVVLPLQPRNISTGQMVLLQAMALAKPVIATRTAGTEDYVDGSNGMLVPPDDPQALRLAIQHVWQNPALATQLGAAARACVIERHAPAQYVRAIARAI